MVRMPIGTGLGSSDLFRNVRGAKGARPKGFRTVGFGASWRRGRLNCYSNRKALTCSIDDLHWFRLGRVKGFSARGE